MREKLLLIGYRAYGDWLYTVPILPFLFENYEVHAEMNGKGFELFHDDPRFATITVCEFEKYPVDRREELIKERWAEVETRVKPDKVLNLWRTLETACIAERYMPIFHEDSAARREEFGNKLFYDAIIDKCREIGINMEIDDLEGLYFAEEHIAWARRWRESHKCDFVVIMPIAGSCSHKVWPDMPKFTFELLDKYPNAYVYLVGDPSVAKAQWDHPRIIKTCEDTPIKQVVLMTKYADYVIGGETGVVVAAGMWGTPKTMLCTASSVEQCCGRHENDYSVQSSVACSPCHKAIYAKEDCESMIKSGEDFYPQCITGFNYDGLVVLVEQIYNERNIYNDDYFNRFQDRANSDIGKKLYAWRWDLVEKYCHGKMSLLDYGCASGAFHKATRNGFDTHGFDVNPYSEFNSLPAEKMDIVTLWDVLEHLKAPSKELASLDAEWLFISTPNVDAVDGKLEDWKHYRPDEHLWHFSPQDIADMLEPLGYEILESNFGEGEIRDPEDPEQIFTVVARKVIKHGGYTFNRNNNSLDKVH